MTRTAVVILNWNGLEYLGRFLGSVVEQSADPSTEVFVADNCSTDGSAEWVERHFPAVGIIRLGRNHGFADGYNLALERISAEYYILINSDVEVTTGWAKSLEAFMDSHPEAAACQPKILSWHKKDHFEYAGGAGGYIDKYGYPFCRGRLFDVCEKDEGQYDDAREIFWTSGSCMIIRSEAWKRCGGLDGSFFAHMEEIDLCWRLLLGGYRLYCNPQSVVYHVGGGSLPYETPRKVYLNFRNNLFMLYKNLPAQKLSRILLIRRLLDGAAGMVFLVSGKGWKIRQIWKAHIDFYRYLGNLKTSREKTDRTFPGNPERLILNKSIVFEFYIKRRRTFRSLITNF